MLENEVTWILSKQIQKILKNYVAYCKLLSLYMLRSLLIFTFDVSFSGIFLWLVIKTPCFFKKKLTHRLMIFLIYFCYFCFYFIVYSCLSSFRNRIPENHHFPLYVRVLNFLRSHKCTKCSALLIVLAFIFFFQIERAILAIFA